MLTAEERQEIEAETARYPTKQAVRLGAMNIVQRHRAGSPTKAFAKLVNCSMRRPRISRQPGDFL
jgi:hypothetical protein